MNDISIILIIALPYILIFIYVTFSMMIADKKNGTSNKVEEEVPDTNERFIINNRFNASDRNKYYDSGAVLVDIDTGVQYLMVLDNSGNTIITPLYNKDGTLLTIEDSYQKDEDKSANN